MRASFFSAIFLAFLALSAGSAPAWAQPRDRHGPAMRGGAQPLDRLLPGIRRAHPGDFYDADGPTYGPQGDPHYHLKWMTPEGRVIWYDTDARSGRVLRSSPGRDDFDAPREDGPPPGYTRSYDGPAYRPPAYGPYQRGRGNFDGNYGSGRGYDRPYGQWRGGDGGRGHRGH